MRIIQARSTVTMALGPFPVGVGGMFAVGRVSLNFIHDRVFVEDTMSDNADEDDLVWVQLALFGHYSIFDDMTVECCMKISHGSQRWISYPAYPRQGAVLRFSLVLWEKLMDVETICTCRRSNKAKSQGS